MKTAIFALLILSNNNLNINYYGKNKKWRKSNN